MEGDGRVEGQGGMPENGLKKQLDAGASKVVGVRFVRGKGGLPENGLEKQLPSAECPGLRKILPHRFDLRALRANQN